MQVIDAEHVAGRLPPLDLVAALRGAHASGAIGVVERMLTVEGPNAALTWAGWHPRHGLAIKTATVFPGNAGTSSTPVVQTAVMLFEGEHGTPRAVIHGAAFTRAKTAADSALGADLLARRDAEVLAVLGTGGQAETHIAYMRAVRPSLRTVLLWNRTAAHAQALAARLGGIDTIVVDTAEQAVRQADLVCCLTASTSPVLHGAWLAPGAHVDLVGGYTPQMREADDAAILRGHLFADSRRFAVECGDYAKPLASGVITSAAIRGDLFDLCAGRVTGRSAADAITIFKNAGGGHLDLIVANAFVAAAGRDT